MRYSRFGGPGGHGVSAGGGRLRARRGIGPAFFVRGRTGAVVDRPHFGDDCLDLGRQHHVAAGVEQGAEFFADRLFDVGEDFGPVGVRLQLAGGLVQIGAQGVVAAFFQLKGGTVQMDGDDFVHGRWLGKMWAAQITVPVPSRFR